MRSALRADVRDGGGGGAHLTVACSIAQPAGRELPRVTRPAPYRAREWLLRGCRRVVRDRSAAQVVRELHGAPAVPRCAQGRTERALQWCEVVGRTLRVCPLQFFLYIRAWGVPCGAALRLTRAEAARRLRLLHWLAGEVRSVRR